jgi:hypothetical protein
LFSFISDRSSPFLFCFIWFALLDYSALFSVLILELYSRYFNPHINNHPASQETSYTRLRHLLSHYRKREPITIKEKYPISPIPLAG